MKTLIAYFSRTGENYFNGIVRDIKKGNTEILAEHLQKIIKADIFKIEPLVPYSDNYRECCEQSHKEKIEQKRPPLKSDLPDTANYDTIFLGFPCWWGTVPMAVVTFLEANRINGKKIIPFVTHEGSGIEIIPSTDTLHLTIYYGTHDVYSETACESYLWHGNDYATTGEYIHDYTNSDNCPSTDTLHLTIHYGIHDVYSETACESYLWHGDEYSTTGEYTHDYTNSDNCPSTDTLHLTIHYGTHDSYTETSCESYLWQGNDYATTGEYIHDYTNSDNCPSTDTLHLTIHYGTNNAYTETSCESYTWHGNE